MTVETEILKSSLYFTGLSATELDAIRPLVIEKKAARGEIILNDGEPSEGLFMVISGAVKLFKTSAEGKEQILSIVRAGESFNDGSIFSETPNQASAQAMGTVMLYEIRKADINGILQKYPRFSLNTITILAAQNSRLVSLVEELSFKHVTGRVAKILLDHAGDGSSQGLKLTQQDMAALAGTAREVVGRSLKSLEEEGIIRLERHRLVIANKEALKNKAEAAV
jgi:CRP-like cAMP-binding protein